MPNEMNFCNILFSNRCHLVFGVHIQADGQQEGLLGTNKWVFNFINTLFKGTFYFREIGTTRRGIGPTYSSKCFRNGIRLADLLGDFDDFTKRYILTEEQEFIY